MQQDVHCRLGWENNTTPQPTPCRAGIRRRRTGMRNGQEGDIVRLRDWCTSDFVLGSALHITLILVDQPDNPSTTRKRRVPMAIYRTNLGNAFRL